MNLSGRVAAPNDADAAPSASGPPGLHHGPPVSPVGVRRELPPVAATIATIGKHSAAYVSGVLFTLVAGFLLKVYLGRTLGARALGLFTLGMAVQAVFSTATGCGLAGTVARFLPAYLGVGERSKAVNLVRRSALLLTATTAAGALAMYLMRRQIARWLGNEELASYLPLFAAMLPLGSLAFLFSSVLRGLKRVASAVFATSFVQFPVGALGTVALVGAGLGLRGYVLAQLAAAAVGFGLLFALARKALRGTSAGPAPAAARAGFEESPARYAATMVMLGVIGTLAAQGDRLLLGGLLDARAVGVYAVALTVTRFVPLGLTAVNQIFGPIIAELHATDAMGDLARLFVFTTKWLVTSTVPLVATITLFSPELMGIFGQEFRSGWPVLVVVTLGQLVNVGCGSVGHLLLMTGHQRLEVRVAILTNLLTATLYLVLIPIFGALGAAGAIFAGLLVSNLVRVAWVHKRLRLSPYDRSIVATLPATLGAVLLVVVLRLTSHLLPLPDWGVPLAALATGYIVLAVLVVLVGLDEIDRLVLAIVVLRAGQRFGSG